MLKMLIITYALAAGGEQKVETMVLNDHPCHVLAEDLGKRVEAGLKKNPKQDALVSSFKIECIQQFGASGAGQTVGPQ